MIKNKTDYYYRDGFEKENQKPLRMGHTFIYSYRMKKTPKSPFEIKRLTIKQVKELMLKFYLIERLKETDHGYEKPKIFKKVKSKVNFDRNLIPSLII